jgi:hypothetical protein
MTNGESLNNEAEFHELNQEAIEFVREQAKKGREKLISFAWQAVRLFKAEDDELRADLENRDLPKDESIGIYVLEDIIRAPESEGRIPVTQTLLLVPNTELGQSGDDRLRLFVPFMEIEGEGTIPPDEVYVEVTSHEGEITRYAINKNGIYEYVSAADTGEQVVKDDLHEDVWERRVSLLVDTGMATVSKIQEDFINMRAIPQRILTVGESRHVDL